MGRNIRTEAIVLKTARMGEIHKSVTLLAPDLGLVQAIAHGVYKGKGRLAGTTDPFAWSTIYLYHEPVKGNYKITDIECHDLFESLRTDLERYYAASLWAEVIIRSHAGGEGPDRIFGLLKSALHALESSFDHKCVQIQFLWRFIALAGFLPHIESCSLCGRDFTEREIVVYRRAEGDFACLGCLPVTSTEGLPEVQELSAGARKYLERTEQLSLRDALRVDLERGAKEQLLALLYRFVQDILEVPLKTLQAGVL